MYPEIPSAFQTIFCTFACAFTNPSLANFIALSLGWILCQGRHTISRVIQAGRKWQCEKHHSAFYRFFSRAKWIPDVLGRILLESFLLYIPGLDIFVLIDDTLCRRSGPHIWGCGMHYDPLASTYGRGSPGGRFIAWAFGLNWVVLAIWVPYPWNPQRGIGIPILFRLYRSKKRCPTDEYRKRTELAVEMIRLAAEWISTRKRIIVVGDMEYACKCVLRSLPPDVDFTGPMPMNAALYDLPGNSQPKRRGRPLKKGARLATPSAWAADTSFPWCRTTLTIYGRKVNVLVKERVALWYSACGTRPIRLILTRDPSGQIEDRAYFSTRVEASPEEVLAGFAKRWGIEVTFYNTKQFMGLQDPQNGWGRRGAGCQRHKLQAGPQPRGRRGEQAIRRTVPFVFITYALVHLWYFQHGQVASDVQAVRNRAPWYRHKTEPSFADMLDAARRAIVIDHFSREPQLRRVLPKIKQALDSLPALPGAA